MRWIYADGIVTPMTDDHSNWNAYEPVCQLVGNSRGRTASAMKTRDPITLLVASAHPWPAFMLGPALDIGPETIEFVHTTLMSA